MHNRDCHEEIGLKSLRRWTHSTLVPLLLILLAAALLYAGHQNRLWKQAMAAAFPQDCTATTR